LSGGDPDFINVRASALPEYDLQGNATNANLRRAVTICSFVFRDFFTATKSRLLWSDEIMAGLFAIRQSKTILPRSSLNDCREPGIKRGLNPAGVL
jgi:hypothetical protein